MFLLLWLQTIPSQTALSGANPISRRIAELSGCVGVCAHGRTAGSQWEQDYAAHCFALLSCPPGPKEAKQASAGRNCISETISLFQQPPCQGVVRAVRLLTAGAQGRAWLLTRREGKSWEAETPQHWGASSLSSCSPEVSGELFLHPHKIPKRKEA